MLSTYKETIDYLFSCLPVFQNQGKSAYKADLGNSLAFDKYRNYPHKHFKSIHVAGTNGKGSVSHIIASALQTRGYKVGLYTSPHLKDFRERIKVNGAQVQESFVHEYVNRHFTFIDWMKPSFFEIGVAMAFDYFKQEKVDFAVIEVGMGGRLDSTNIITPQISIITNISLDHMQFLGDSIGKIAYEKAGIIKPSVPVVIGEVLPETETVFREISAKQSAELIFAEELSAEKHDNTISIEKEIQFVPDLKGNYQLKNYRTAYAALKKLGFADDISTLISSFEHVVDNTGLMGRWHVLNQQPLTICDTAHNVAGLGYVSEQLKQVAAKRKLIVWGMLADKDADPIISLLPADAEYFLCQPNIQRKLPVEKLALYFTDKGLNFSIFNSVAEAVAAANEKAEQDDLIFIGGSTFVVAEALP